MGDIPYSQNTDLVELEEESVRKFKIPCNLQVQSVALLNIWPWGQGGHQPVHTTGNWQSGLACKFMDKNKWTLIKFQSMNSPMKKNRFSHMVLRVLTVGQGTKELVTESWLSACVSCSPLFYGKTIGCHVPPVSHITAHCHSSLFLLV